MEICLIGVAIACLGIGVMVGKKMAEAKYVGEAKAVNEFLEDLKKEEKK